MSGHSSPQVDRIALWVYYSKVSTYPIFYLLQGDYSILTWVSRTGFDSMVPWSLRIEALEAKSLEST